MTTRTSVKLLLSNFSSFFSVSCDTPSEPFAAANPYYKKMFGSDNQPRDDHVGGLRPQQWPLHLVSSLDV